MPEWTSVVLRGGNIVQDLNPPCPGSSRQTKDSGAWPICYVVGLPKIASNLFKSVYGNTSLRSECVNEPQDLEHLVKRCPITGLYRAIHAMKKEFSNWTSKTHDCDLNKAYAYNYCSVVVS